MSRRAEEVESQFGLLEEVAPQLEQESGMDCGESSGEMVFERLDCSFRCIGLMIVRLRQLQSDILG